MRSWCWIEQSVPFFFIASVLKSIVRVACDEDGSTVNICSDLIEKEGIQCCVVSVGSGGVTEHARLRRIAGAEEKGGCWLGLQERHPRTLARLSTETDNSVTEERDPRNLIYSLFLFAILVAGEFIAHVNKSFSQSLSYLNRIFVHWYYKRSDLGSLLLIRVLSLLCF